METSQSRRTLMKPVAGAGIATSAARSAQLAVAQDTGVDSGGIGLLRWDFEAAYGPSTELEGLVEYPYVDVGVAGAKMYAQFRGDVVDRLEVRWAQAAQFGGIDWGTAYQAAVFLLPVDAQYRDQFWMPATPEGPMEIIGHTYENQALNLVSFNLGRTLVLFQRDLSQMNAATLDGPLIPAVTITMAEVGQ